MAAILFPELQFNDNSTGSPLASGKIYTYVAGTTTPTNTFTDNTGGTSVGVYVNLDSNGRPNSGNGIWLDASTSYKFIIKNSAGTTVQTVDNIETSTFTGASSFVTAIADATLVNSRALVGSASITLTDGGAGGNLTISRPALTGDVTASAGSNATTIANNAVTTSKILDANVTTAKIADANVTTAKILDANVTTAKIADSNVTTAKILDANVTTAKIADSNITTAKILDANITLAKLADIGTNSLIGRDTAGTGVPESITLGTGIEFTGSGTIQRSALTGDVTATAGSNTTTIDVSAITGKTEDTSPVGGDYVLTYDTSASALKKASIANLFEAAGVSDYERLPTGVGVGRTVGDLILGRGPSVTATGTVVTINQIYYILLVVAADITSPILQLYVDLAQASKNFRLGLYLGEATSADYFKPTGAALYDSGNLSTASGGDTATTLTGITLTRGVRYYVAFQTDANLAEFATVPIGSYGLPESSATGSIYQTAIAAQYQSFTYGAFPTPSGLSSVYSTTTTPFPRIIISAQ